MYEGRADDMIKIGGLWASPIEIENALVEHPRVLEAAAVGVDADYTTRVEGVRRSAAATRATTTLVRGAAGRGARTRLHRYKFPHFIVFVDELPKTPTGKIQRFKLREEA